MDPGRFDHLPFFPRPASTIKHAFADCEVYPGQEVHIVDTGEFDDADLGSLFSGGGNTKRGREHERGFKGTALAGGPPDTAAAAAMLSAAAEGQIEGVAAGRGGNAAPPRA